MGWPGGVPAGACEIPLWRNVSGTNFHLNYQVIDYTVVEDADFYWINQDRWFMQVNSSGDRYAYRTEYQGKKKTTIYMAREILGLSRSPGNGGDKADHINHNTLDNRRSNLRPATPSQSTAHTRGWSSTQRFKCTRKSGNQYESHIGIDRLDIWFSAVSTEVEAALKYNYAAWLVYQEFAELNVIPEDEMPTVDRQWELYDTVVARLRAYGFPCEDALKREEFDLCA